MGDFFAVVESGPLTPAGLVSNNCFNSAGVKLGFFCMASATSLATMKSVSISWLDEVLTSRSILRDLRRDELESG